MKIKGLGHMLPRVKWAWQDMHVREYNGMQACKILNEVKMRQVVQPQYN